MASTAPPPSAPGWLARWSPAAALRRRFRAWWQGRLKRTDTLELTQRNVYILPTGPGWMLAVTLVVLLIASINFQLNLGYLFTFMLAGSAVIGMHISHATLRGLTLHLKQPQPQFMGSSAALEVQLTSQRSTPRYGIGIAVHGGDDPSTHADHHWAWTDVPAQGQAVVHIAFQPQRRGLHPVPTLTAETRFPLGTFALPESQLDRFLMRISIGYPDRAAERLLLAGSDRRDMVDTLPALLTPHELAELQRQVLAVHTSDALLNYVQDLVDATRSGKWFLQGLSPRAGIALMRAAKAQALISGRDYVAPDDVQAVLPQTIAHRLVPVGDAGRGAVEQVRAMVDAVPLA